MWRPSGGRNRRATCVASNPLVSAVTPLSKFSLAAMSEHIANRLAHRKDDPVPTALTVGGIFLSVVGAVGGALVDWDGFVANLLNSVVLIGPALVISNVVVVFTNRTRSENRAQQHVGMLVILVGRAIDTANDLHRLLGVDRRIEVPEVFVGGRPDVHGYLAAVRLSKVAINLSIENPDESRRLPELRLAEESYSIPNYAAVRSFADLLAREVDCLNVTVSAVGAEYFSAVASVDLVTTPSIPSKYDDAGAQSGIMQPLTGLAEISTWFDRATSGRLTNLSVESLSYFRFVDQCLYRAEKILEALTKDMPARLLAPPTADSNLVSG